MFGREYQGNMWWIGMGLLSLFILWQGLWSVAQKRTVGVPVDVASTVGLCLLCLSFLAFSVFQVLTHDR